MRLTLAAFALLLTAADAAAQRRPDSVSLRFKWPPGTAARVDQEWVRVQSSDGKRDSITVRSRYRLRLIDHAEGQLIAADSFVITDASGFADTVASSGIAQALTRLGSFQPSFVVSAEGEFKRVEGVAQMKQLFDSLIAPLLADIKDAPAEAQALLRNSSSEQAMSATAAQDWNAIVGTWTGADFVVGEAYETTIEETVPLMAGLTISMRYEFGASERVPCTPAMRPDSCVRLELYSEPDTSALRKVTADILTRFGVAGKDIVDALRGLRTMNELTVIAEPLTLRPYSVTRVRRVEATVEPTSTEKGGKTTRLEVRTARYSYAP